MSDSDDTDVLLLIPPDLFVVPSSDSENSEFRYDAGAAAVNEILEHVQSLETRINAIESKDGSLDFSLLNDSPVRQLYSSSSKLPRAQGIHSSLQLFSLPNTPAKKNKYWSSPKNHRGTSSVKKIKSDEKKNSRCVFNAQLRNRKIWKNHDDLSEPSKFFDDTNDIYRGRERFLGGMKNWDRDMDEEATAKPDDEKKIIKGIEISEVDELLQEMEATEIELAKRINNTNSYRYGKEFSHNFQDFSASNIDDKTKSSNRRLDFQFVDETHSGGENFADVSLPSEEILQHDDTEKMILGLKNWDRTDKTNQICDNESENLEITAKINENLTLKEIHVSSNFENFDGKTHFLSDSHSLTNIQDSTQIRDKSRDFPKGNYTFDSGLHDTKLSECTNDLQETVREIRTMEQQGVINSLAKNVESKPRKFQKIPDLSDFWNSDGTKSQEDILRIKLEEEKFRREHCEEVIQELQKRILEEQEKVAVAIRVDNEKKSAILQFQNAWSSLKKRWEILEKEHSEVEGTLKNLREKHNCEIIEYQRQMKRGENELSKAIDLAAGYKEKSDILVKEKLNILKSHADELEKYKNLVQEAEERYEILKIDYKKMFENAKNFEEISKNTQQELNKERLRNSEVKNEMAGIHKALDSCEAELILLRQEKENLSLKIKDEMSRNEILEKNKISFIEAMNNAKIAEKAAKDEVEALVDRQERLRSELREIYQNQVDDVVKTKLKEFQQQLDSAEMAFQVDLETKQRAIAECAARKIKSIIDKHQLEINLLEEKHMEEKRLWEIQLAQVSQKATMLESQLNMQRATKTQLAEQLHSVMQKQWQQALQIISGGNMENLSPLQRLNAERFFDGKKSKRCNSACCNKIDQVKKSEFSSSSLQNLQISNFRHERDESLITLTSNDETPLTTKKESKNDLRKYIKMILDMQQPKNDFTRGKYMEQSNSSPPPVTREVPRKHYTKKEPNELSEESAKWQQVDEQSVHDTSDYIPMVQPQGQKSDQQRNKPPWK